MEKRTPIPQHAWDQIAGGGAGAKADLKAAVIDEEKQITCFCFQDFPKGEERLVKLSAGNFVLTKIW